MDNVAEYVSDYQTEINALLNSFRWFEIDGPLNRKNTKRYNSQIKKIDNSTIEVKFKPNLTDSLIKYNYEGSVFVNSESNQIDSVHIYMGKRYSYQHDSFVIGWMKIILEWNENKCWPQEIISGYVMNEIELVTTLKTLSKKPTYINLDKNDFNVFIEVQVSPLIRFEGKYWENNEFLSKSTMVQIQKDLNGKKTLQQQFIENCNKPYRIRKLPNGEFYPKSDSEMYIYFKNRMDVLLELVN